MLSPASVLILCLWNVAGIQVVSLKTLCKLLFCYKIFWTILYEIDFSPSLTPTSQSSPPGTPSCNFRQIAFFLCALCFYLFKMRTRSLVHFAFKSVTLMNKYINTGVLRECKVLCTYRLTFHKVILLYE